MLNPEEPKEGDAGKGYKSTVKETVLSQVSVTSLLAQKPTSWTT